VPRSPARLVAVLAMGLLACRASPPAERGDDAGAGTTGSDASGAAGASAGDAASAGRGGTGGGGGASAASSDPGWVGVRRLSDVEYVNTVRDLLGLSLPVGQAFSATGAADPRVEGFDNNAAALSLSPQRMQWYFTSALSIADQVFADAALRARVLTCAPASATDGACDEKIVRELGRRAWRRPLTDDEVSGLVTLARGARTAGEDFAASIQEVVTALLVSDSFLFRVELDPQPDATTVHAVGPWELASRLSYLLWSSMPDDTLFGLAASGELLRPEVQAAQVTRLLADARSDELVRNFAGQWLSFRDLDDHFVNAAVLTPWTATLRQEMQSEARLYVGELLRQGMGLPALLTADFNFVDDGLAAFYGLPASGAGQSFVRVENAQDARQGYLGLAAFLTVTSNETETSPSRRGAAILRDLLCVDAVGGAHVIKGLPAVGTPRQRFATRAAAPECASCHVPLENLGLGLEGFDAIGRPRTKYAPNDFLDIDTTSTLWDGTTFHDLRELAAALARDPRFLDCASRKAVTYAFGHALGASDAVNLALVRGAWGRGQPTLGALLSAITASDGFRFRRGEGP
jgi:hypothetical protein